MARQALEVSDIFRSCGPAWRRAMAGHLSLGQLKVMSAIERCRRADLGGHVLRCERCAEVQIAYNSCRDRHCPKYQASAAKRWLAARQAELLPVDYYHVVFTLPAPISDIAYQNKSVIYGLLFKAAAETLLTIARDPRHLGARIGVTMVLHTWGSALTHHPHVHCIVPGGGLAVDRPGWQACKPETSSSSAHISGWLTHRLLPTGVDRSNDRNGWCMPSAPLPAPRRCWRICRDIPIANSRLIAHDARGVTFKWKDYREKGRTRHKTMTLASGEFIRRFLLHVLPHRFHHIRHYGLFANGGRANNLVQVRHLLNCDVVETPVAAADTTIVTDSPYICPACGSPMIVIEIFARGQLPRAPPGRITQCA